MTVCKRVVVRLVVAVVLAVVCTGATTTRTTAGKGKLPAPTDLRVRIIGTASFQGRHTALIEDLNTHSDSFYKVGDPIYGYKIKEITADGVTVEKGGKLAFVSLEPTSIRARQTETDEKIVLANTYLPSASDMGSAKPNFYTDAGTASSGWSLLGKSATQTASTKKPAVAGKLASSDSKSTRFTLPVAKYRRFSSGFGYRKHPIGGGTKMHKGIDLAANRGTRILAADSGKVKYSGWKGGYGYCIIIDHNNGYETLYGHCSKLIADVGDNVRRGDLIGQVGSTGASTGNHLHFEVHKNGVAVDPEPYLPNL